jgi:hypothetical protein
MRTNANYTCVEADFSEVLPEWICARGVGGRLQSYVPVSFVPVERGLRMALG